MKKLYLTILSLLIIISSYAQITTKISTIDIIKPSKDTITVKGAIKLMRPTGISYSKVFTDINGNLSFYDKYAGLKTLSSLNSGGGGDTWGTDSINYASKSLVRKYVRDTALVLRGLIAAKQNTIISGTTTQYYRGDKTWQTLNTSNVPELTNLYFTESRVRSSLLTGFTAINSNILATDNILQAFNKTQGQINIKENSLGNPSVNGYVLSSTTGGIRSWIAPGISLAQLGSSIHDTLATWVFPNNTTGNYIIPGVDPTNKRVVIEIDAIGGGGTGTLTDGFLKASGTTFVPYPDSTGTGTNRGIYYGISNPTKTTRLNINASIVPTTIQLYYNGTSNAINVTHTGTGSGMNISNSAGLSCLTMTNSSSFSGSYTTNTSTGTAHAIVNSSTGKGVSIQSSGGGTSLYIYDSGTGTPISIENSTGVKFKVEQNGEITSTKFKLSALNTAPSSSSDTGILGEIRIVNGYIYVCVATNTWQRAALTTW